MSSDPPRALGRPGGPTPSVDAARLTSTTQSADPSATASSTGSTADGAPPGASTVGLWPMAGQSFGRYTLLTELGAGGMGTVFKAWDPALDRPVALKVMHGGRLAAARSVERFLNEARAVARLTHPAIVEVHDFGLADDVPYFTMALVDGPNLGRWLRLRQPQPAADADPKPSLPMPCPRALCAMLAPVARALAHAHRAGVIHRDIKPANLLVTRDGAVRLVDFGVARLADAELTRTGQVIGTPAYMAPEQARGAPDVDARVDIYGLGAVIHQALLGAPPRPVTTQPLRLPGVERDLEAICLTALAADRGQRYPDADAFAADLERFARGEPVAAAAPGLARRFAWWVRRRRVGLLVAGGLLSGLVAGQSIVQHLADRRALAAQHAAEQAAEARLGDVGARIYALRAAGRGDEARALRDGTVGRLDVQGTAALARFFLDEGRAALDATRGASSAAPEAFAAAYAQTDDPDLRRAALIGLGAYHRARAERAPLQAVVETLARVAPAAFEDPEARILRAEAALLARDLPTALPLIDGQSDHHLRALRALARQTPTGLPREQSPRTVEVRVERVELPAALLSASGLPPGSLIQVGFDLARPTPNLPAVARLPEPPDGRWARPPAIFFDPEGRAVLLGRVDGRDAEGRSAQHSGLYRLDRLDAPPVALWRAPGPRDLRPALQADLDGDGRSPIWFAPPWTLHALTPHGADRWTLETPDRRMPRTGSITFGLASTRPPGAANGPAWLAVALGEWRAYDLRLLGPDPSDAALALRGRLKLGHVTGVTTDGPHHLWAITDGVALNPRMFPADAQPTEPTLYRITAGAPPTIDRRIPLPPPAEGNLRAPRVLDVLGDGRPAVALLGHGAPSGIRLVLDARGPAPWVVPLPGLTPLAALDLDGDGDDELVVRGLDGGSIRVLGAGADPLEPLAMPSDAMSSDAMPLGMPSDGMPTMTSGMPSDPLDDLIALGRLTTARDQLRLRAEAGRTPVAALMRAGALSQRLDDPTGAARDFTEAARRAEQIADKRRAWLAAADAWRDLRDVDSERAALTALADVGSPAERRLAEARLKASHAGRSGSIRFEQPLSPSWHLGQPDRVSRSPDGLRVDARSLDGLIAAVRLSADGRRLSVRGTLSIERAEFGSGLVIGLTRVADAAVDSIADASAKPEAALLLAYAGGAGTAALRVRARARGGTIEMASAPEEGPIQRPPTPFRVELDADAGEVFIEWGAGDTARRATLPLQVPAPQPTTADPGAAVYLTLATHRLPGGGDAGLTATLGPLTLSGLAPSPPTAIDPIHDARRRLADGDPDGALTALADAAEMAPVDRAAALDALDRTAEADAALAGTRGADPATADARDRLLRGWMHQRPGETLERVERIFGAAAARRRFLDTWALAADVHPRDPAVREAMAAALGRFDPAAVDTDPERVQLAVQLIGRAAESAAKLGRHRMARRAFDVLFGLVEALPVGDPLTEDRLIGWMLSRAELAATHGDPAGARHWVDRARERSGVPELVLDHVRASARLGPLLAE